MTDGYLELAEEHLNECRIRVDEALAASFGL